MAKILLMEDDLTLRLEWVDAFEDAGHEVSPATSATEAIAYLESIKFDILITDMIVYQHDKPVPDGGPRLINWVRNTRRGMNQPNLPIIAITGAYTKPGLNFLLPLSERMGADETMRKPFDIKQMLARIEALTNAPEVPAES